MLNPKQFGIIKILNKKQI